MITKMGTIFKRVVTNCIFPELRTPLELTQVRNQIAPKPVKTAINGFSLSTGMKTLKALTKAMAMAALATHADIQ